MFNYFIRNLVSPSNSWRSVKITTGCPVYLAYNTIIMCNYLQNVIPSIVFIITIDNYVFVLLNFRLDYIT